MRIYLYILLLAVTSRLVTSQEQAIPGEAAVAINAEAVSQLGTDTGCTSHGDVIFVVDRSAGQSVEEFGLVQEFLKKLVIHIIELGLGDCYKTALVSFSKKTKVEYGFMYGNLDMAFDTIDGMKTPKGQGFAHNALLKTIELFENDENPSPGGNKVVLLFTDGASNDKTATIEAAKSLKSTIGARVLVGKSINPKAVAVQQLNRDGEINGILANSVCGSGLVYEASLIDDPPPQEAVLDTLNQLLKGPDPPVKEKMKPELPGCPDPPVKEKMKPELPGCHSDSEFLCEPKYAGIQMSKNDPEKWVRVWEAKCGCKLDDDDCVVPKANNDCECTSLGCPLTADGETGDYRLELSITPTEHEKLRQQEKEKEEKEQEEKEKEEKEEKEDEF